MKPINEVRLTNTFQLLGQDAETVAHVWAKYGNKLVSVSRNNKEKTWSVRYIDNDGNLIDAELDTESPRQIVEVERNVVLPRSAA